MRASLVAVAVATSALHCAAEKGAPLTDIRQPPPCSLNADFVMHPAPQCVGYNAYSVTLDSIATQNPTTTANQWDITSSSGHAESHNSGTTEDIVRDGSGRARRDRDGAAHGDARLLPEAHAHGHGDNPVRRAVVAVHLRRDVGAHDGVAERDAEHQPVRHVLADQPAPVRGGGACGGDGVVAAQPPPLRAGPVHVHAPDRPGRDVLREARGVERVRGVDGDTAEHQLRHVAPPGGVGEPGGDAGVAAEHGDPVDPVGGRSAVVHGGGRCVRVREWDAALADAGALHQPRPAVLVRRVGVV